jgi:hypothetical protein
LAAALSEGQSYKDFYIVELLKACQNLAFARRQSLALRRLIMKKDKYAIFDALNPFFEIVQEGLTGFVDANISSTR